MYTSAAGVLLCFTMMVLLDVQHFFVTFVSTWTIGFVVYRCRCIRLSSARCHDPELTRLPPQT